MIQEVLNYSNLKKKYQLSLKMSNKRKKKYNVGKAQLTIKIISVNRLNNKIHHLRILINLAV